MYFVTMASRPGFVVGSSVLDEALADVVVVGEGACLFLLSFLPEPLDEEDALEEEVVVVVLGDDVETVGAGEKVEDLEEFGREGDDRRGRFAEWCDRCEPGTVEEEPARLLLTGLMVPDDDVRCVFCMVASRGERRNSGWIGSYLVELFDLGAFGILHPRW
ncbi:hypothetical protein [Archangium lansingense]|uniref:Uncharacterized protein n=1 Tax=Archangium lansingense TaxID=2995310 RepID=A0ABT4AGN8_9BACT|nr:hypothetical protein [Archangium lansinium]MCY1080032.1 hypothetical protein [Archangium lansinium]